MIVPDGLRVRRRDSASVILERDLTEDANQGEPDRLVGTVPLVQWTPKGRPAVVELAVTPPPPFASSSVEAMWQKVSGQPVQELNSIRLQGRIRGSASLAGSGFDPDAVPAAVSALAALKRGWPELETTELIQRPPDVRGGREDVRATDRMGGRRPGRRTERGVAIPDLTARRRGSSYPWGSRRLSAACLAMEGALASRSEDLTESAREARRLAISVARHSRVSALGVDSPPSSWPSLGRSAFQAVIRALVALSVEGAGTTSVPLCELWRLYEAWTVVTALETLSVMYGPPTKVDDLDFTWEWTVRDFRVRLHSQATIGEAADPGTAAQSAGVVSVSSTLRPDFLLSVQRDGGGQAVICGDAKQRTAGTAMDPRDIAEAASKYAWGLRSMHDPTAVATAKTLIVSSAAVVAMFDGTSSRIGAVQLLPESTSEFSTQLVAIVEATIADL